MVERGLGVYVPKARSTNSLSMARVCDSCCWSIQLFPRGQCSPVRRALMGLVWIDDGKEPRAVQNGVLCELIDAYLAFGSTLWEELR